MLRAQTWNDEPVRQLVRRGIARRMAVLGDSGIQDYAARAQGFVFFLAQVGEEFREPPRLVKTDQLSLEVYWKAPGASKQRIVGRRDRVDLPTDIAYHRDHLGIVQNNFGDRIRLGDGHEVRDVLHPLASQAEEVYDYALIDSLAIRLPQRLVSVYEVAVRPNTPATAAIVGSLFLDASSAELVRLRFTFSASAYLDATIEDITIVLDNGLWDARFWLPRHQEIEIRRRTPVLELPARGIIRARWDIDQYHFNGGLPERLFRGPEIVQLPLAELEAYQWEETLDEAMRTSPESGATVDLEEARTALGRLVSRGTLSGLSAARIGAGSVSDFLHYNRVEGLSPGLGGVVRPGGGLLEVRGWLGYGLSDERLKGRVRITHAGGARTLSVEAAREIRDLLDEPVISRVLNSVLAQELGDDFGDYILLERAGVEVGYRLGSVVAVAAEAGWERASGVAVAPLLTPATGRFRPNPDLEGGDFAVGRLRVERAGQGFGFDRQITGQVVVEAGRGEGVEFVRVSGRARFTVPVAGTQWVVSTRGGWGSAGLPRHRLFVLGGRGTLVGEPFRAWGGRSAALARVDLRIPVPVPELRFGPWFSTGSHVVVAPYLALGWAWRPIPGTPWPGTGGARPVAGVALEWFQGLIRTEFGFSLRDGELGVTGDVRRDFWGIL